MLICWPWAWGTHRVSQPLDTTLSGVNSQAFWSSQKTQLKDPLSAPFTLAGAAVFLSGILSLSCPRMRS